MARNVKEEEYNAKRNEIIDAAQGFVYAKGYDQMSVQDILDAVHISKGAFYHYFDSKGALLGALIDRMQQEAEGILLPILHDPDLNALEKLRRFFERAASWKMERKTYILALLRVWYADENALVRLKVQTQMVKWAAPMLGEVVRQGIREGSLNTPFPDQVGQILLAFLQSLGDAFVEKVFICPSKDRDLPEIEMSLAAFNNAIERVLGAPKGALQIMDIQTVKEWLTLTEEEAV